MEKRNLCRKTSILWLIVAWLGSASVHAQIAGPNRADVYGPYNARFLADGTGLVKPLVEADTVLSAGSPWTVYCWFRSDEPIDKPTLLIGVGTVDEEYPRYLGVASGQVVLWTGKENSLVAPASLGTQKWHFVAATFDRTAYRLYSDGAEVGSGKLSFGDASPVFQIAPWREGTHFGGEIASATLAKTAFTADQIRQLYEQHDDFSLLMFEDGSKTWPVQTRSQAGYRAPQDPATMPRSRSPQGKPAPGEERQRIAAPSLEGSGWNRWTIGGWRLAPAPGIHSEGSELSRLGVETKQWLQATVPGTVLTTMVDRGVYPDPDYGLNNLQIPEALNKQDYWYRTEFRAPERSRGKHVTLVFQGINYKAEVWLNGQWLGRIKGAFLRGTFDVTSLLRSTNALAVKISPPPHPGIPQEQSIQGGPGENGGLMCLDGPTFVATEGWDWIPAIRDRDTGIWQPVVLLASGAVKIGDAQVVTTLPLPDTSRADVEIAVPLENTSGHPIRGVLAASFDKTAVRKSLKVPPGKSLVKLTSAEFSQLVVQHPRLWWPNGYGNPDLYGLELSFSNETGESDRRELKFGIREITYELSLLDATGHLRRLEFDPSRARPEDGKVINVSHEGIREIPSPLSSQDHLAGHGRERSFWVASLQPGKESSPSLRILDDPRTAPYLVVKVNGVRIACRGGNWGMDDSRKRVSRNHLEPFFRLHREANLNIIRNWVGQNTEEVFYDLADEYGLLVWNDFWESTQNYNLEAEDPELFLLNARDTILRFRNHPSILLWCGRNEGVPQPILNNGLEELVRTLDGTRYYSPSSNQINLEDSGPYQYKNPALYYTTLNRGFSVETGTPSMSTLESFRAWIPKEDQWPLSDAWAYHDWHQSSNGDVASFLNEMQAEFGAASSLADFDRKVQMLNYVSHRAIFEGMNAHLWAPNSGRLLWMTQPAWPSTMWQILSSDYDTQASFYGVKKACEPVHVQLDLSDYDVSIINTTQEAHQGLSVDVHVFSLDNRLLLSRDGQINANANSVTRWLQLDLPPLLESGPVIVKLQLRDVDGHAISDNLYWLGQTSSSYRQLNTLPAIGLRGRLRLMREDRNVHLQVELENPTDRVALLIKMTPMNPDGSRILPAYLEDNYFSLLPGEKRVIEVEYPAEAAPGQAQVGLRGWNLTPLTLQTMR